MVKKTKTISILAQLALIFMTLNVSTIYSYYFVPLSRFFLLLGGILTLVCMIISNYTKTSKKAFQILCLWSIVVIFCTFNGGFSSSSINYLVKVFIIYLLIDMLLTAGIEPLNIMFKICRFMTYWALINYLLLDVLHVHFLPSISQFSTSWGYVYKLYLGVFMENTQRIYFFGEIIKRLHVPFSEPGVAQLFFNFTFFYILFIKEKKSKKDRFTLFISLLTIVMSNSLTGFLILGSMVLFYCIKKKKLFLITLLSLVIFIVGFYMINEKLTSDSYLDRRGDYVHMISNAIDNLPFGIGIGNTDALEPRINDATGEYASNSNFCGLLSPLLYFGFFSIIYYVLIYFSIAYYSFSTEKYAKLCLAVIILITLFTEPLALTSFFIYFELNGLLHKLKYRIKKV